MSASPSTSSPAWLARIARLVGLSVVAGVLGYFAGQALYDVFPNLGAGLPEPRWSDVAAAVLAVAMIAVSLGTALATLRPAMLGRILKLDGPAGAGEIRDTRVQAAVTALSGLLMVLPPAFAATAAPATLSIAAILVLAILHIGLNLKLYRSIDELYRRIVMEAGALTFWAASMVLFACAAAERLGVAPPLTGWDVYVVLMGVYLVVSMVVTVRRGLA
jgi:hypothetical protein